MKNHLYIERYYDEVTNLNKKIENGLNEVRLLRGEISETSIDNNEYHLLTMDLKLLKAIVKTDIRIRTERELHLCEVLANE